MQFHLYLVVLITLPHFGTTRLSMPVPAKRENHHNTFSVYLGVVASVQSGVYVISRGRTSSSGQDGEMMDVPWFCGG